MMLSEYILAELRPATYEINGTAFTAKEILDLIKEGVIEDYEVTDVHPDYGIGMYDEDGNPKRAYFVTDNSVIFVSPWVNKVILEYKEV